MPQKKKTQIGDTGGGRQTEIKKEERRHTVEGGSQFCGSVIFSDQCLLLTDPDPDPAIFIIDFHEANKKLFFQVFLFITF
jgi:hypothetical protein